MHDFLSCFELMELANQMLQISALFNNIEKRLRILFVCLFFIFYFFKKEILFNLDTRNKYPSTRPYVSYCKNNNNNVHSSETSSFFVRLYGILHFSRYVP